MPIQNGNKIRGDDDNFEFMNQPRMRLYVGPGQMFAPSPLPYHPGILTQKSPNKILGAVWATIKRYTRLYGSNCSISGTHTYIRLDSYHRNAIE